jgi:type IV pilus assembly protein PilA
MLRTLKKGFTLVEVLLVIAIIAILASIVIMAINPPRNISSANNAQRWSNVNTILNAVHQYAIDNRGQIPSTITTVSTEICKTGASCAGLIDLSVLTDQERYVLKIPTDPTSASANGTGYFVNKDAYGRVTVNAPFAEIGDTITVSR